MKKQSRALINLSSKSKFPSISWNAEKMQTIDSKNGNNTPQGILRDNNSN